MTADPTPHQQHEFIQRMQQVGLVPSPHAYRWRNDGVAHRPDCSKAVNPGETRVFRYDYQLEFWLYAGSMELCAECKPGEFP